LYSKFRRPDGQAAGWSIGLEYCSWEDQRKGGKYPQTNIPLGKGGDCVERIKSKKEGAMSKRNFLRTWLAGMVVFLLWVSLPPADGAAQVKPITLKMTVWTPAPELNVYSRANSLLVREVEKRSGGRLKIEYYWSGSLLPAKETVSGLKTGVADLGFVHSGYEPGKLPLSTVASLPAISHDY
jgi:hypothetical protein